VPEDRKAAALALAEAGFYILPVRATNKEPDTLLAPSGFRDATRDADVISGWFDVKPHANIGIACGPEYGLVVLDVDVRADCDGWQAFQAIYDGWLTLTTDTPSTGAHFYFRHPGVALRPHLDGLPGIDIKGASAGAYVLAPPSALPAGAYRWKDETIPVADLPASLLELLRADKPAAASKEKAAATGPVASIIVPEGHRHTRLVALAARYRGLGLDAGEIEVLLWDHAQHFFDPPFSPDNAGHRREVDSVLRWYAAKPAPETEVPPLEVLTTDALIARAAAAPVALAVDPVLPAAGNLMIYGPTGAGKSHLGLAVALALSTGTAVLDWHAPSARRVLFIDGEMPLGELQARLVGYLHGQPAPGMLLWLAARAGDDDLPDMSAEAGQARYMAAIEACGAEVVFFDNLSCLRHTTADAPENSAEAWHPVAAFLRRLNGRGIATVTMHHASKAGGQRGSSHHTAVMDTVIQLKAPGPGQADPHAANDLEIVFEKHRRFFGEEAEPFRAKAVEDCDGFVTWSRGGTDPLGDAVVRLRGQGKSVREIAKELGRSKRGIEKAIARAQARGMLPLGAVHD